MNTLTKILLGSTLALAVSAGPALAQGAGQGAGGGLVGTHCKREIATYCGHLKHGRTEIPKCLESHFKNLSQDCKWALANKGPGWGGGWQQGNQNAQ
ncbi:hypothetical protein GGD81_004583 [Rhodobium orientis]|uniref:Uncharacterized protein n=1 Tax=Rhodobium orientis TaxID=34017 RepID=A0A327JFN1_9HYPH|nr:cysteine rich repeat-containing protein [Rhodobium orientis]MBB4305503.1 hypothetical protein [Rhodobium orientis]MBK5949858.1 hypothetical protein [Rhodobium orientis]RAI24731.1 hypothetical protein CH339_21425 [Rhodobium orientis]